MTMIASPGGFLSRALLLCLLDRFSAVVIDVVVIIESCDMVLADIFVIFTIFTSSMVCMDCMVWKVLMRVARFGAIVVVDMAIGLIMVLTLTLVLILVMRVARNLGNVRVVVGVGDVHAVRLTESWIVFNLRGNISVIQERLLLKKMGLLGWKGHI